VFEAYGTDQVGGRVILTTTILDRLKSLDETAQARGFRCAFLEDHLMVAFPGMTWLCSWWWIVRPVGTWIDQYRAQLAGLIELPVTIVRTLNLDAPTNAASPPAQTVRPDVPVASGSGQVFSSPVFRLVGEGGMALVTAASGLVFGGVAIVGGWYGVRVGYSAHLFWYFWTLIAAGLAYGAFAMTSAVRHVLALAWRWNANPRAAVREGIGTHSSGGTECPTTRWRHSYSDSRAPNVNSPPCNDRFERCSRRHLYRAQDAMACLCCLDSCWCSP